MEPDILVAGATGRLGSRICALGGPRVLALDRSSVGDAQGLAAALGRVRVVLDVLSPDGSLVLARSLLEVGSQVPLVVGSTGHGADQKEVYRALSQTTAVCLAPNFSPGVWRVVRALALLRAPGTTACIWDVHHEAKRDAPSGTATLFARALGSAEIVSSRLGDVPGTHTILLAGQGEEVMVTHRATSRDVFARGALELCGALLDRPKGPGLCTPLDVWDGREFLLA